MEVTSLRQEVVIMILTSKDGCSRWPFKCRWSAGVSSGSVMPRRSPWRQWPFPTAPAAGGRKPLRTCSALKGSSPLIQQEVCHPVSLWSEKTPLLKLNHEPCHRRQPQPGDSRPDDLRFNLLYQAVFTKRKT